MINSIEPPSYRRTWVRPTRRLGAAAGICLISIGGVSCATVPGDSLSELNPGAELCLGLIRIDDSEILDARHMLFTTTDKQKYLNTLPKKCGSMGPGDTYSFRTSMNRLCRGDVITILYPGGLDFIPGASCVLGMFEPVTQEQVDALELSTAGE